jgi:tripartite-type tricarboxylate transporter receptor subunit TctC
MNRRGLLALGSAALAGTLAPRLAAAQGNYPERPIKLMVAFSAGGVNDVVARQWAERVKMLLGTVYVENQGGGSGTIATGEVARAARRLHHPARQHQHHGAQPDDHGQGAV